MNRLKLLPISSILAISLLSGCSPSTTPHTHSYEKMHDEQFHWEECSGCDEGAINKVEHSFVESHVEGDCEHVGKTIYTCECGYTKTVDGELKHNYVQNHDDEYHWEECSICHDIKNKVEHILHETHVDGDCTNPEKTTFTCECGYTKTVDGEFKHKYVQNHDDEYHWEECNECGDIKNKVAHDCELVHSQDSTCEHGVIEEYKCKDCDFTYHTDDKNVKPHNMVTEITKVATCRESGTKYHHCTECSYSYNESYSDIDSHKWNSGEILDGVTTYRCLNDGCDKFYTVISFKEENEAKVNIDDLAKVSAVELKEATVKLDENTLAGLTSDVTIGAEKVTVEEVSEKIPEETKELLKDAPIFDFSLKDGEEDVHEFLGEIEISVPYDLQDGEDPDAISIVYINDEGESENIPAKYNNNQVTFKTSHFSVYAVVRMSKEQMCEKFGHLLHLSSQTNSTCVEHGYLTEVCTRCGKSFVAEQPLVDHDYVYNTTVNSTQTEHGYVEYICKECGDLSRKELPLLPSEDKGFYMNLIRNVSSSNFEINLVEYLNGKIENSSLTAAVFNDEQPFVYAENSYRNGSEMSLSKNVSDASGTYYLSSSGYIDKSDNSSFGQELAIFKTIASLPDTFETIVNYVFDKLEKIALSVELKDGLVSIKLDEEKINNFIEIVKKSTLKEIFDEYFGLDSLAKIIDFVRTSYARPIGETIEELKKIGIDVKEIFDFISLIVSMPMTYEEMFTEDMLSMPLSTVLAGLLQIEIPIEQINSLLTTCPEMKIFDIVQLISPIQGSEDEFWEMFDYEIGSVFSNLDFEIIATEGGQLIEVNITQSIDMMGNSEEPYPVPVSQEEVMRQPASRYSQGDSAKIYITVRTDFDVQEYREKFADVKNEVEKTCDFFDFSGSKGEQKALEILEDYFGVPFSVVERSEEMGYFSFKSETTLDYTRLLDDSYYKEYYPEFEITDGYITGECNTRYLNINGFNDYHHITNLNSDHSLYSRTYGNIFQNVYYNAEISITDDSGETYSRYERIYISNLNYLSLVYDPISDVSEKTFYNNDHFYKNEQISYDEFKENSNVRFSDVSNYTFIKQTCIHCGYVNYNYYYGSDTYGIYEGGIFITPEMNEAARKYRITFKKYYNNESVQVFAYNEFDPSEKPIYFIDECRKNGYENKDFHLGNVTISVSYTSRNNHECSRNEIVKLLVDDKVVYTYTNHIHIADFSDLSTEIVEHEIDECHGTLEYITVCHACGEIVDYWTSKYSNHTFESEIILEPTNHKNGIEKLTCSVCGEVRTQTYYGLHTHWFEYDPNIGDYVCSCGLTKTECYYEDAFELVDGYQVINTYNGEEVEDYVFAFNENLLYSKDEILGFAVAIKSVDEEGNVSFEEDSMIIVPREQFGNYDIVMNNFYLWFDGFTINRDEYDSLKAKAESEGKELAYIVIGNIDSEQPTIEVLYEYAREFMNNYYDKYGNTLNFEMEDESSIYALDYCCDCELGIHYLEDHFIELCDFCPDGFYLSGELYFDEELQIISAVFYSEDGKYGFEICIDVIICEDKIVTSGQYSFRFFSL